MKIMDTSYEIQSVSRFSIFQEWRFRFLLTFLLGLFFLFSGVGCARHGRSIQLPHRPPAPRESDWKPGSQPSTKLIWPVRDSQPRITSIFGEARGKERRHKGVDIGAPLGEPVYASASGVTTFSGARGAYGNLIILRHDGDLETAYAHLHTRHVSCDQVVRQGQQIGTVGSTGNSTGPHLHFETRKKGLPVDPLPLLPRKHE